jgi:hypothetical protein
VHANDFSGMFASTTLRRIAMTLNFKECLSKIGKQFTESGRKQHNKTVATVIALNHSRLSPTPKSYKLSATISYDELDNPYQHASYLVF